MSNKNFIDEKKLKEALADYEKNPGPIGAYFRKEKKIKTGKYFYNDGIPVSAGIQVASDGENYD